MKKLILILPLLFAFTGYQPVNDDPPTDDIDDLWDDIYFRDLMSDCPEDLRSLIPGADAWVGKEKIKVRFNKTVGVVTVTLTDSYGSVYFNNTSDYVRGNIIYLDFPGESGSYTLRIEGKNYIGEGIFERE